MNLVLIPYLLHRLGPGLTGVYLVLMTVANFMAVGIGWLAGAGVRSIAKLSPADSIVQVARVYRVVVLGFAMYSTAVLVVMVGASRLAGTWWLQDTPAEILGQVRLACVLLGVYVWITYVHNADLALLTALLRQGEANLYRVLAQALFGLTAFALLMRDPRIDALMAAQVAAALITAVFVRVRLRFRGVIGRWEWSWPDRALLRQILVTTGASYFLFGLAQFVLMYADVFVVGAVLGSEAVTAYVVVWRIAEFAGLLLSRISETLSPYLHPTRIARRRRRAAGRSFSPRADSSTGSLSRPDPAMRWWGRGSSGCGSAPRTGHRCGGSTRFRVRRWPSRSSIATTSSCISQSAASAAS